MRTLRMWVAIVGLVASLVAVSNSTWLKSYIERAPAQTSQATMVASNAVSSSAAGTTATASDNVSAGRHNRRLVVEVTDNTYDREVVQARDKMPVLIWFDRPERSCFFSEDLRVMETIAKAWSGEKSTVKVVRVDTTKLKQDGRIEQEFRHVGSTCQITFTIMQDFRHTGAVHHHDTYLFAHRPLDVANDLQRELLDFRPDCYRSNCQLCTGQVILGVRPLAWR